MAGDGMQIEGAVGLVTVQENRDRRDGDVGQAQRHKRVTPPGETKQAEVHRRLLRKIRMRKRQIPRIARRFGTLANTKGSRGTQGGGSRALGLLSGSDP